MLIAVAMFALMDTAMKLLSAHYPAMQVTALRSLSSLPLVCAARLLFSALGLQSLMSSALVCFIPSALFATRANIDYFKKMVLDDEGWL